MTLHIYQTRRPTRPTHLMGDAGWEDRIAIRGGRRPRAGGGEAPKRRRCSVRDSVKYESLRRLSLKNSLNCLNESIA
ncbi:MAG: hypothetical protein B7Y09_24640 [Polaromonas sp. 24-63-21]|nr:MAG: hypothetical protein B7Y09_24640 [Polaromonas sp. 24-63-21]